ncbi:hypothetical protein [cyanobacterium endosymbiont of Rhopalodia gibberula]|uniref:hypothetical protein n=1 Tax=cyanobacterium endosymbiont of Rhopalodia gibberula TaxID=1763363 RepID=UPI001559E325|nr:hypothetical protein [cyanobacterium endosymbiont of Rhopalodia gibberula]
MTLTQLWEVNKKLITNLLPFKGEKEKRWLSSQAELRIGEWEWSKLNYFRES